MFELVHISCNDPIQLKTVYETLVNPDITDNKNKQIKCHLRITTKENS